MRIFIDSAYVGDIIKYADDPDVAGFTTNATLVKNAKANVDDLVDAAYPKEISVEHLSCIWRDNVRWKITDWHETAGMFDGAWNLTAICSPQQVPARLPSDAIISVFAGRITDTGRHPGHVLNLAHRTGAQVLWASSRSVWDITMARSSGCDIITVTPAIYEKYREWDGKPLEEVAALTIAQFEADR